jgi:hypothetical protein
VHSVTFRLLWMSISATTSDCTFKSYRNQARRSAKLLEGCSQSRPRIAIHVGPCPDLSQRTIYNVSFGSIVDYQKPVQVFTSIKITYSGMDDTMLLTISTTFGRVRVAYTPGSGLSSASLNGSANANGQPDVCCYIANRVRAKAVQR